MESAKRDFLFFASLSLSDAVLLSTPSLIIPPYLECPVPPFGGVDCFSISPDGTEIAFVSKPQNRSHIAWSTTIHVYRALHIGGSDVEVECLTENLLGESTSPVYQPSGQVCSFDVHITPCSLFTLQIITFLSTVVSSICFFYFVSKLHKIKFVGIVYCVFD